MPPSPAPEGRPEAAAPPLPREVVLVLGMHRSGTSALARALNLLGLGISTRPLLTRRGNEGGHWESEALVGLSDEILSRLGSPWDGWRRLPFEALDAQERARWAARLRAAVATEHAGEARVVLKDPRASRLLPLVREALAGTGLRHLLIVRHPDEVVASLRARGEGRAGQDEVEAPLSWLRHNLDAERETRGHPRAVLSYDDLLADWRGTLARAGGQAGIEGIEPAPEAAAAIDGFLAPAMRHHRGGEVRGPVADWCGPVFAALRALALDPGDEEALATLDRVRASLDGAEGPIARILETSAPRVAAAEAEIRRIHDDYRQSTSWRVTAPLRAARRPLEPVVALAGTVARAGRAQGGLRVLGKGARILAREGLGGVRRRLRAQRGQAGVVASGGDPRACLIVTTPHVEGIARMMAAVLREEGFRAEIAGDAGEAGRFGQSFVLCPQMFDALPDGYVAFQMEQSVSPRWFTPDYRERLGRARMVLDYSLRNIAFLGDWGVEPWKLHHVPLDIDPEGLARDDAPALRRGALFYGDANSPRRREMLARLREAVPELEIVTNLFGEALRERLRGAAVVLNIHYYEDALLETARIHEALGHGAPVVSEPGADQEEHGDLEGLVDFVPVGDVEALAAALRRALDDEGHRRARMAAIRARAQGGGNRFRAGFRRALLSLGMIDLAAFTARAPHWPLPEIPPEPRLCLTLPETPERRRQFLAQGAPGFVLWDGLRADPGWIGAGLSHAHLAQRLLAAGVARATVCEDDALLPPGFAARLAALERHLAGREDWDLFSGFLTEVHPDLRVLAVEEAEGTTFVTVDRTVGLVFNIYRPAALERLARWDPSDRDVYRNAVDRWLERAEGLRVVVALPFLMGHRRDAESVVWGGSNARYDGAAERAERRLEERVAAFRATRGD